MPCVGRLLCHSIWLTRLRIDLQSGDLKIFKLVEWIGPFVTQLDDRVQNGLGELLLEFQFAWRR